MFALIVGAACAGRTSLYPPGWNAMAKTPPMGWRSWNAFGNRITQSMMLDAARALVSKNRTVTGRPDQISLCDLGFCSVGVDEGWEGCGAGVNGSQHDARGRPTINTKSFPDIGQMVKDIHALKLSAGWYLNGCKCGERHELLINYEGDVASLMEFGFDGVKIDGCGRQRNQTLYAELLQKNHYEHITIENCHWGRCTDSDDSSCPTQSWCPFNWYRTSGDINSGSGSWLRNLQTTLPFQNWDAPLSVPSCYAYPDMLEVGRVDAPSSDPASFFTWNRAHFGAWCIVSAPLILGLELTDAKLDPILEVISNTEAIAVNQRWAGHPGGLVENIRPQPVPFSPSGATVPSSSPSDFDLSGGASIGEYRADAKTSGAANIRTGNPGQVSHILIGGGLLGEGHQLESVSLSFRYVAGYTPAAGQAKKAAQVRLLILEMDTQRVVAALQTTPPLGAYSYDHFTSYSKPVTINATNLSISNTVPLVLALEVTNHERNLQIPIDDKAKGFDIRVRWSASADESTVSMHARRTPSEHGANTPDATLSDVDLSVGRAQVWAKPQPGGAAAALIINNSPRQLNYTLQLGKLNLSTSATGVYSVRDIWAHRNRTGAQTSIDLIVKAFDSAFLLISPAPAEQA